MRFSMFFATEKRVRPNYLNPCHVGVSMIAVTADEMFEHYLMILAFIHYRQSTNHD